MASLLVSAGEEGRCRCVPVSFSDWSAGGAHPRHWAIDAVDAATMHYLRWVVSVCAVVCAVTLNTCRTAAGTQPGCGNSSLAEVAQYLLGALPWRAALQAYDGRVLEGCPLFARKVVE